MRIVWWLPVHGWRDWAQKLLDYGFYAHTHYDQNLLLADPTSKKFTSGSINADILIIDRELFPIPDGYIEYDSTNDVYKIYFWTAFRDLMNILKSKGIILANTGGMFGWYLCTKRGVIPYTYTSVSVEYPWGWETVSRMMYGWGGAEWSQDIWAVGDKTQRALYYYVKGTDPGKSIQEFTNDLCAPLPFTGLVYPVLRALKVETPDISAEDIGFTPLVVRDYEHPTKGTIKVAVTGINFNCPVMIYGIAFGNQYDAINVIIDIMTGMTSVQNYSVIRKVPVKVCDNLGDPMNFAWAWAGSTHLKWFGKIMNTSASKVMLSLKDLIENELFVKIPKELMRYAGLVEVSEETERVTLDAWSQVDTNTWQSVFSTAQDFTCDFGAGIVRLLLIKLNVTDTTGQVNIRLRAYTTDTDYFEEERNLWNWHCCKEGEFWLVWAICAVPNSRFGTVVGSPNTNTIAKVEIYISDPTKVMLDTNYPPLKVTVQKLPRTRYAVIDRGGYFLVTWWNSDGNFSLDPYEVRHFIVTINPTPWLDVIHGIANMLPWDSTVQQIYNDALDASFYYEVFAEYQKLADYLRGKGVDLTKKTRDLVLTLI